MFEFATNAPVLADGEYTIGETVYIVEDGYVFDSCGVQWCKAPADLPALQERLDVLQWWRDVVNGTIPPT